MNQETVEFSQLPVSPSSFLQYVESNPNIAIHELVKPFIDFENYLRFLYLQCPTHKTITGLANLIDIFAPKNPRIHFRQSNLSRDKIIMPLEKPKTGPVFVQSLEEFRDNLDMFTHFAFPESDFDWSNIVVAGGAVAACLTPLPGKSMTPGQKRGRFLKLSPKGDVDIFLYGLPDEEAAIDRIKKLEKIIHRSGARTVVRTVNCLTLVSEYPQRHIQIILRLYQSISEILLDFDVDSCSVAYNGKTVYANPRAVTAFISQCNILDLTRRSPSYEPRLIKYAMRGFEIYYDSLDRSRVNPEIFHIEKSQTHGLARLLFLEHQHVSGGVCCAVDMGTSNYAKLVIQFRIGSNPTTIQEEISQIDNRLNKTCREVCAVCLSRIVNGCQTACGHVFDYDCLVQWLNRNSTCPSCRTPCEHALITALPKASSLHRHPGSMESVITDCCGQCPLPEKWEEQTEFLENSKLYVSGKIKFVKNKMPLGSFYTLSPEEYSGLAYHPIN